jgi:fibronectin-binding autotransporter adhesin
LIKKSTAIEAFRAGKVTVNYHRMRRLPLKTRSSSAWIRLSLFCGAAFLPLYASAQTWVGTVSSDYQTAGNWSPNGIPNSSGANLVFGAGANTTNVTLSTPYPAGYTSVGSITFNDPASAYSVSVSNTAYLSIFGNVVNTSGITQNFSVTGDSSTGAASEIILNNVNAGSNVVYTANAYGTIQVNGPSSLSSARFVLNGGSIAFSGAGVLALGPVSGVGILAYYGNPNGSTGTFQLGGANDSATLTAQIQEQTGSAAVEKVGTGTLTLDGPSSYTGGTTLASGGLLAGNNTALGTGGLSVASGTLFGSADGQPVSLANTVTLASGSETIDTTGGDLTLTGAITETGGSAALTKTGTGSLILAADETYSGGTTISNGVFQLGNGGTSGSVLGNIVDNGMLNFDRSDNVQFGQVVSGSGGVGQIGTGTLTLTAANSFTGAVNVAAGGTLAVSGSGSIATASGVQANGTFDISGATSGASIKSLSGAGAVNLGGQTLTLTQAGGTFSGTIGGAGGVTISSGNEVLTGSNSYTGTTHIATGSTLQLGNGGATGSIAGDVSNAGTLAINRTGDVTIAGAVSGTGSIEKAGSGTLILSGDNSYSGGTIVTAGTLSLTTDQSAGTGTIMLANGTALALANGLDVTNALDISGKVSLIVANGSAVESGVLTGNGTYSLSGGGTLHLTGNNSGFGGTTVLSGLTVDLATDSALGAGTAKVAGNATLHYENGIVIAMRST